MPITLWLTAIVKRSAENHWVLKCDGLVIFIGDVGETLNKYEKMHKDLRLEWIVANKTEKIEAATKRHRLENTITEVRRRLLTFAGKDILSGHCELC